MENIEEQEDLLIEDKEVEKIVPIENDVARYENVVIVYVEIVVDREMEVEELTILEIHDS